MENLIAVIGIWFLVSIPASLLIARFLSATNPETKTHRASLISFRQIATPFDRGKEKMFSRRLMQDDTQPSKNV